MRVAAVKDNLARYSDGHAYCFGCKYYEPPTDTPEFSNTNEASDMITGEHQALNKRKINLDTTKFFNYQVGQYNGQTVQIAPYYNDKYQVVAQHIRFPDKNFIWLGNMDEVNLYGQHKWKPGGKMIVVTEGELDCMSVSMVQGNRWPTVSVPSGAQSAKKYIKNLSTLKALKKSFSCLIMMRQEKQSL